MEKEVSLVVKCPLCSEPLMDKVHLINKRPSVKINIETAHERGVLRLCGLYGNSSKESDIEIEEGEIVSMFCPHCNKELSIKETCETCGAPLIAFVIKAGGVVRICSRNGCTNHHIVFKEVSEELSKFYYEYGF
ncbi:MAG: hypothetical protein KJ578_02170 [Bacteroidetes bacterium]|nr:hypothetical protein [Bacteroidota bacterium]MBU1577945.1 hypothetical protein [Bacteroidota bacterium]MBU2465541.1 hypothetical protein [Bacteroidota bacterium]MBU2556570.1 hypothetical protein [Bacteroidota bacterium]